MPEDTSIEIPSSFFFVLVFISISDTEAIDGSASPLKPNEDILLKFSKLNLEVACLLTANSSSFDLIPSPLSDTTISVLPPSRI